MESVHLYYRVLLIVFIFLVHCLPDGSCAIVTDYPKLYLTGSGGYSYLYEPLWWTHGKFWFVMFSCSAALAHIILRERLHIFRILGCVLCVVGCTTIVLHAPQEREIEFVSEVWDLAMEPVTFILIFHFIPLYGQTHIMVYIGVCSLIGSITVMSVKALGIVIKLTMSGMNQLIYPQTWAFSLVVIVCVLTQMNYLNKTLEFDKLEFRYLDGLLCEQVHFLFGFKLGTVVLLCLRDLLHMPLIMDSLHGEEGFDTAL
ncbi:putative magnesium transporter NIPA4 [Glycine soja]